MPFSQVLQDEETMKLIDRLSGRVEVRAIDCPNPVEILEVEITTTVQVTCI